MAVKNCKNCLFYDKEYDQLLQSGDDLIIIGQETKKKHDCRMYEGSIDDQILSGETECEHYVAK